MSALLHVDGAVQLHHIRQDGEALENLQRVRHIEHVDHGVDAGLSGLVDGQLQGFFGRQPRYHHGIGGGVCGQAHLQVAGVQRLQIQDDEGPWAHRPDLLDHIYAQHLHQRRPDLDQDVIALRQRSEHAAHLGHIHQVKGHLQVRRVPEPGDPEAHDGVRGAVLLVEHQIHVREAFHRPLQSQLGRTVVVAVDGIIVLGLGMDEDGYYYHQLLRFTLGNDALGHGVCHRLGHGHLRRTEDLCCLLQILHSHLGHDKSGGLRWQVRPNDPQEGRVSCRELSESGGKGHSHGPLLLSDEQVDMSYLRLFPDESLTY
ncbi:Uncharacterised protein [uncultured archaeon]|nr:Uncharacterised protein [uncultured archaeon]